MTKLCGEDTSAGKQQGIIQRLLPPSLLPVQLFRPLCMAHLSHARSGGLGAGRSKGSAQPGQQTHFSVQPDLPYILPSVPKAMFPQSLHSCAPGE